MTFENKLKKAHQLLEGMNAYRGSYNPPSFQLLRTIGIKAKPTPYNSFLLNSVYNIPKGALFILILVIYQKIAEAQIYDNYFHYILGAAIYVFVTTIFTHWKVAEHRKNLPNWEEL